MGMYYNNDLVIEQQNEIAALEARVRELEAERDRLRDVLAAVDAWDLNWADGLDENVERIKDMARAALKG